MASFLEAGGGQGAAQAPLHLLVGAEATRFKGIGQVGGKAVVAHQPGYLLDQINFTTQVLAAGRGHDHIPAFTASPFDQLAAQGRQGVDDLTVFEIVQLTGFAV
jgi:hypothetical protein